jgi:hypothetical protein
MIVRIGREFGMTAVRVPREPLWYSAANAFLLPWVALMKARLRAGGIAYNDQVFGIAGTGRLDEEALLNILAKLPPGVTEIYLHPAVDNDSPITPTMSEYRHSAELAALLSSRVSAAVAATGAIRGGYRDIRSV